MSIPLLLLLLVPGAHAAAAEPVPGAAIIESTTPASLPGLLSVDGGGCSGVDNGEVRAQEFRDGLAIFRKRLWLTSREDVTPGQVNVTREGNALRAEVELVVEAVRPGELVATCVRPVELELSVPGLAEGNYDVQFVRKAPSPD